jgi:apolipoprotein N-acyltransferase
MSSKYLASAAGAILLAAPFLWPTLFPLAWFAFVPLFWAVDRATTWRRAVLCGWLMGLCAHLIGFYWLVYTISVFGGFPQIVSVVVFVLYAALQAVQLALFAALVRCAGFGPLALLPGVFWVTMEFVFPLLFPWHVANSQVAFSWFIQSADLVGPYGASFIVVWSNGAIYRALVPAGAGERPNGWPLAYAALAVIASLAYGMQRLEAMSREIAAARKLSVAAVQGNVDIDLKWNPELAKSNLEKHRALTAGAGAVSLVIWPESAIEEWVPEDLSQLPPSVTPKFESPRTFFIFGAKSFRGKLGAPGMKAFNSAFFTQADGRVLARYHKQVLLAFGEYLPFSSVLSLLPAMPFADGFTPGPGPVAFHLGRGVRLAPLICYEDLMPGLARAFVSETRAKVLVNLTNDAWYGRSVGPWQHLWLAQSRAIETRRSLLRVTNTGVTSLVNAKGEIVQTLPMFNDGVMQSSVDVLDGETYYVRFGDWFAWTLTAITVALVLLRSTRALRKDG